MQELISIIIPIYNAEKFLEKCLESVLGQSYQNIEVLCINDSSTDNSLQIVCEYALKDNRVKVYTKNNEGVSKARNFGIANSSGSVIMFVDADDWIERDTCSISITEMCESGADVIMWAYISEFSDKSDSKYVYQNKMFFDNNAVKEYIHRRFVGIIDSELSHPEKADSLCSVWGKLYKKRIIEKNHIKFIDLDQIGTYEDGLFNLEYFQFVNSAVYLPEAYYHYRRNNNSSQTSKYRENLPEQWNYLYEIMRKHINKYKLPNIYNEALDNRIALSILGLGLNIMMSNKSGHEKRVLIKTILTAEQYKKASLKLKIEYMPFHWQVFYGSARCGFTIGVYILLLFIRKIIYG